MPTFKSERQLGGNEIRETAVSSGSGVQVQAVGKQLPKWTDMLGEVNDILGAKGLLLRTGTAVDATLIAAPSSTTSSSGASFMTNSSRLMKRRLPSVARVGLGRELVIAVMPREPRPSLLIRAADATSQSAPAVTLAALQPPPGVQRDRISLKLLVDCSGSMSGDSIASARAALHGVVNVMNAPRQTKQPSKRSCTPLAR